MDPNPQTFATVNALGGGIGVGGGDVVGCGAEVVAAGMIRKEFVWYHPPQVIRT